MSDTTLDDFLTQGLAATDLPPLAGLLRAKPLLNAFITLFRGGEDEVYARLLVLREIGARADAPRWSPQELQAHFAYLNPTKLDTVLKRLREYGLLLWDGDEALYQLSEPGRVALAALATVLHFADQDGELGYLTAQVAAGQALGQVSHEALQHLLARLNELYLEFEAALESQSEYKILQAQQRLEAVWRWVQKGTDVIRDITADEQQDIATLNQAQAIALAQSRLLRLQATFQRRLHQLQSQRVHLGQSGLTSSDLAAWLRKQSQVGLAGQLTGMLRFPPQPAFVTVAELADVAEFELVERERQLAEAAILPSVNAAPLVSEAEAERLFVAERLFETLQNIDRVTAIQQAVLAADYPETAYRLSLLTLLGDTGSASEQGVLADLVKLPLRLQTDGELDWLDHPDVAALSRGQLCPPE